MNSINSGKDYAKYLAQTIYEVERSAPVSEKMPEELVKEWVVEIYHYADQTWNEYLTGRREGFEFTEEEMDMLFDKAGLSYTSGILNGLVDKDLVKVEIDEKGEMLYGLTEKGTETVNKIKGYE